MLVFIYLIPRWRFFRIEGVSPRQLQGVFLIKVAVGLVLYLVYTQYYSFSGTSDAFRYIDDARIIRSLLFQQPDLFFKFLFGFGMDDPDLLPYFEQMRGWTSSYSYGIVNDNPTIIRLNVLIGLFSFGYYHVHTVFMSFLSMIGGVGWLRGMLKVGGVPTLPALISAFLLPSVLFWSSGVLKEAPLMFCLGILFYQLVLWKKEKRTLIIFWIFLLVAMMFFIKGYVIWLLLPAVISLILSRFFCTQPALLFILVHVFLFSLTMFGGVYEAGDFIYVLQKKQEDFVNVARVQSAGSFINAVEIQGFWDVVKVFPQAVYRTLFRPDWRDITSGFHLLAFLENLMMMGGLLLTVIFFKKPKLEDRPWLYACVSAVLSLGFVIGFCVPILGAIVRYKVPMLPFFVWSMLLCLDIKKMKVYIDNFKRMIESRMCK